MRTKRHTVLAVAIVLALVSAACGGDDANDDDASTATTEAGPTLSIESPATGTHIKGNVVSLQMETSLQIVKADGSMGGPTGHFHVFIDKDPVEAGETIEKAADTVHSADNPVTIPGLSVGEHTLTVVLGDGAHMRLGDVSDKVTVTVDGPSVDATAPATLKAGEALSIDVAVAGVSLVKADGDTSGKTGHLHVFVDVAPVAPGEPIATGDAAIIHSATSPISVTGLKPGEHTIWVVLGDGAHMAFKDSARDKVVVTVT